ncbi:protein of unknown function DUF150 [Fibrisoma limi BUZ 3]|uniref:Ribosome maturation factor RimP n=1 Tax=Fibrisoma limi BUZ 3 TaxID=1185876 RepID=I2GE53_9BACT|nr:ribosome maturation factor RimP [Fibrisoma limi]CCH52178.1 protein of unknown function DUF150 [Fibrisoma limi BUZ 3]
MDDKTRIAELIQPYLNDGQFYIVDCQVAGRQGGRIKVTLLLDSDTGITIDECVDISRRFGAQLDETDLFDGAPFTLEVSSPGVDHPLTFPRQYRRNIGRRLKLTLTDGTTRTGVLESVADDQIILNITPEQKSKTQKKKDAKLGIEEVTGPVPIRFDAILKANVEISFK